MITFINSKTPLMLQIICDEEQLVYSSQFTAQSI